MLISDICQYKCINTLGSFKCSCPPGYTMNDNKCYGTYIVYLIKIKESPFVQRITASQSRDNKAYQIGSIDWLKMSPRLMRVPCSQWDRIGMTVTIIHFILDIDECASGLNDCASNEVCHNTGGSFRCLNLSCNSGYQLKLTNHDR